MRFVSTRGGSEPVDLETALLTGLAPDGGLYVPTDLPRFTDGERVRLAGLCYPDLIATVLERFGVPDAGEVAAGAYARFGHPDVAPLVPLDARTSLLELFHGPTLSFKDHALSVVGELLDRALARRGERALVLGATSGDTGSAAIEALRGRASVDVVILHPAGRVSDMQRRQMTTVLDANVLNVAVEGTFDDCQALVKQAFLSLGPDRRLAAVNSINVVRLVAQSAYHLWAALQQPGARVVVPSGNFGNALSAVMARRMGAPLGQIVAATNTNRVLAEALTSGTVRRGTVVPTIAPAMDIQVPSNLERFVYDLLDRDPVALQGFVRSLEQDGAATLPVDRLPTWLSAGWADEDRTRRAIAEAYERWNVIVDPHTAVALAVADDMDDGGRRVIVSTAHPAKFPDVVVAATGQRPPVPEQLAGLAEREERFVVIPPDLDALRAVLP